jgi:ribosomal protein L7Ae-like RNA K-turn-binding protein
MNLKYCLFFIVILFFNCKTNNEKTLQFAYNEKYKLDNSERTIALDKNIIEEYEENIGLDSLNVPLNKYILGENYKVFIGIALENNPQELVQEIQSDSSLKIFEINDYKTNAKLFCKKNNYYQIKYLFTEKKENLPVLFNIVSTDSLLIKKLYNENKILDKIN